MPVVPLPRYNSTVSFNKQQAAGAATASGTQPSLPHRPATNLGSSLSNLGWLQSMYQSPDGPSVPTEQSSRHVATTRKPEGRHASTVPEEDERSVMSPVESAPWFEEEEFSYDSGAAVSGVEKLKFAQAPMMDVSPSPQSPTPAADKAAFSPSPTPSTISAAVATSAASYAAAKLGAASGCGVVGGPLSGLPANASDQLKRHAANAAARPPYAYSAMIYMAVHAVNKDRVQLGEIYNQIQQSWAYYRARPDETGWKNSIRHNLTVSRCFKKVARAEGESGKGGYWTIDEALAKVDVILTPRVAMPKLSKKLKKKRAKAAAAAAAAAAGEHWSQRRSPTTVVGATSGSGANAKRVDDVDLLRVPVKPASSAPAGKKAVHDAGSRSINRENLHKIPDDVLVAAAASSSAFPAHLLDGMFEDEPSPESRIASAAIPPVAPGHSTRVVLGDGDGSVAAPESLCLSESFSMGAGMLGSSMNMGSAVLGQSFSAALRTSLSTATNMGSTMLGQSFSSVLGRGCLVDA